MHECHSFHQQWVLMHWTVFSSKVWYNFSDSPTSSVSRDFERCNLLFHAVTSQRQRQGIPIPHIKKVTTAMICNINFPCSGCGVSFSQHCHTKPELKLFAGLVLIWSWPWKITFCFSSAPPKISLILSGSWEGYWRFESLGRILDCKRVQVPIRWGCYWCESWYSFSRDPWLYWLNQVIISQAPGHPPCPCWKQCPRFSNVSGLNKEQSSQQPLLFGRPEDAMASTPVLHLHALIRIAGRPRKPSMWSSGSVTRHCLNEFWSSILCTPRILMS